MNSAWTPLNFWRFLWAISSQVQRAASACNRLLNIPIMVAPDVTLTHLNRADGSATYTHNGYSIIGAVNGPIEVQRRDEMPEEATIEVNVRPASGVGSRECPMSCFLHSKIFTHGTPRSQRATPRNTAPQHPPQHHPHAADTTNTRAGDSANQDIARGRRVNRGQHGMRQSHTYRAAKANPSRALLFSPTCFTQPFSPFYPPPYPSRPPSHPF